MTGNTEEYRLLHELAEAVIALDVDRAIRLCEESLQQGIDAYRVISEGLAAGMDAIGDGYEKGVYFVPEMLLASDVMHAGMEVLQPHLAAADSPAASRAYRGIIGVMEGDIHDIGKNLVRIMFEAAGFRMTDLECDVPARRFVETAVGEHADIICLSSLMTTAAVRMGEVTELLTKEGIRERFKVMVGGACLSPSFAARIGADGYAPNAVAAVRTARLLLQDGKSR